MNKNILAIVYCIFLAACGQVQAPIEVVSGISPDDSVTSQDNTASLAAPKISEGAITGELGQTIPLPLYSEGIVGIPAQRVRDLCVPNPTGEYRRSQTDPSDPVFGKAGYQSSKVKLLKGNQFNLSTYKSTDSKDVYPAVYYYMGGAGSGETGGALDAGTAYVKNDGWQPYVQVEGKALSMRLPAPTPASPVKPTTPGGKVVYKYAYRFDEGQDLNMEAYTAPDNTYYVNYTATGKKLLIAIEITTDPKNPEIQRGLPVADKTSSPLKLAFSYNNQTPGWISNPTPSEPGNLKDGTGQPLKFATSIAYNSIYRDGKLLSPQEKLDYLAATSDSISGMTWYNQTIGVIDPKSWDAKTKKYTKTTKYERLQWIKKDKEYSDCTAPMKDGRIDAVPTGQGEIVSIYTKSSLLKLKVFGPQLPKVLINKPVKIDLGISLDNPFNLPTAPVQWKIDLSKKITPQSISAQSILDLAFSPGSGTVASGASAISSGTYTCPAVPGDYPFSYTVSDPSGFALPSDFTVTVSCIGPKMTPPTPNPITLSAAVGSTASGSFSFGNVAEATPSGERAPLSYSVSGSTGLSVSPASGTVEGGGTASIAVSYPCTVAGSFPLTATVKSDDAAKASSEVQVVVTCSQTPPIMSAPVPNPLNISAKVLEVAGGDIIIKNSGNLGAAALTFSAYDNDSGDLIVTSVNNTVAAGQSAYVHVEYNCSRDFGRTINFQRILTITSNDPNRITTLIPINVTCVSPILVDAKWHYVGGYDNYLTDSYSNLWSGGQIELINSGNTNGTGLIWSTNYGQIVPSSDSLSAVFIAPISNSADTRNVATVTVRSIAESDKSDTFEINILPISVYGGFGGGYADFGYSHGRQTVSGGAYHLTIGVGNDATNAGFRWDSSDVVLMSDGYYFLKTIPCGNNAVAVTFHAISIADPTKSVELYADVSPYLCP